MSVTRGRGRGDLRFSIRQSVYIGGIPVLRLAIEYRRTTERIGQEMLYDNNIGTIRLAHGRSLVDGSWEIICDICFETYVIAVARECL